MQRGTYIQDLPAVFLQFREGRATDVEAAFEIDVDNRAESVGRHLFGSAKKISGGAVDDNIHPAKAFDGGGESALNLPLQGCDIGGDSECFPAGCVRLGVALAFALLLTRASLIAAAAGSRCSMLRLTSATLAPASARARATPPVMPVPPPVTNAT